jgi:intracellular sulfur oxidation DsrE/DsrF family protein
MYKLFIALFLTLSAALAQAQDIKVVYHITTGIDTVAGALYNIQKHIEADPKAKIVVVTNGAGIDFLLMDAKDSKGREFSGTVSELAGMGVEFRVCNNTLVSRNLDPSKILMETTLVPSGVAEAAMLQIKEGFAYIKP